MNKQSKEMIKANQNNEVRKKKNQSEIESKNKMNEASIILFYFDFYLFKLKQN